MVRRFNARTRARAGTATAGTSRDCDGTCCGKWRGCPARTGWSCSFTPVCCATTMSRPCGVRNRHRPRHPGRDGVHRALRPILETSGTTSTSASCCSPSTRPFSRELAPLAGFYPSRVPRCAVVVPRHSRRHAAVPPAVTDTAGFFRRRASSTTPGRSAPSPRGTTPPGGSTRDTSRTLSPTHVLTEDEALETAVQVTDRLPRDVFRLG